MLPHIADDDDRAYTSAFAAAVEGESLVGVSPDKARSLIGDAIRVLRTQEPAEVPRLHLLRSRAWMTSGMRIRPKTNCGRDSA